jgi:hypothetical protein
VTRVASGRTHQARVMGDTASNGTGNYAPANWIGLSPTASATADGDTTLTGEITTGTLARAQATFAYTPGANSYTLTKTFQSDQAVTLNTYAVFNAAAAGSMVFKGAIPSPPALVSGDQVAITETVSLV